MKIINYFRELLATLQRIERHLARIASTVRSEHHKHGDRHSLSTKHWNDNSRG